MTRNIIIGVLAGAIAVLVLLVARPSPPRSAWTPPKVMRFSEYDFSIPPAPTTRPAPTWDKVLPSIEMEGLTLKAAIRKLQDVTGLNMVLSPELQKEPQSGTTPSVTFKLTNVPVSAVLKVITRQADTGYGQANWWYEDGILWVGAQDGRWEPDSISGIRVYNVRDLIAEETRLELALGAATRPSSVNDPAEDTTLDQRVAAALARAAGKTGVGAIEDADIHCYAGCLIVVSNDEQVHRRVEALLEAIRDTLRKTQRQP